MGFIKVWVWVWLGRHHAVSGAQSSVEPLVVGW